jgi:hypothetical protein
VAEAAGVVGGVKHIVVISAFEIGCFSSARGCHAVKNTVLVFLRHNFSYERVFSTPDKASCCGYSPMHHIGHSQRATRTVLTLPHFLTYELKNLKSSAFVNVSPTQEIVEEIHTAIYAEDHVHVSLCELFSAERGRQPLRRHESVVARQKPFWG